MGFYYTVIGFKKGLGTLLGAHCTVLLVGSVAALGRTFRGACMQAWSNAAAGNQSDRIPGDG